MVKWLVCGLPIEKFAMLISQEQRVQDYCFIMTICSTQMQVSQMQVFLARLTPICFAFKGRMSSADAITSLQWVPLDKRRYGHKCCLVQSAIKEDIPEYLDVFRTNSIQIHGYNTRNGYLFKLKNQKQNGAETRPFFKH